MSLVYESILGHSFLSDCMFPCSSIYKLKPRHMLLNAGYPHLGSSKFANIRLPTVATTRYKNVVPLVLIRIPFIWAQSSSLPTTEIRYFNKFFIQLNASLKLSRLSWWILFWHNVCMSSEAMLLCTFNVKLSPEYSTLPRQSFSYNLVRFCLAQC